MPLDAVVADAAVCVSFAAGEARFARSCLSLSRRRGAGRVLILGAPASADELVKFASAGGDPIQGYLTRPKGAGPFPAVVLLHTCLGLPANRRSTADAFAKWGYVALFVDDFSTRGLKETCAVDFNEAMADAYGALGFLAGQPFVDAARIAAVGFSQGGDTALRLAASPAGAGRPSRPRRPSNDRPMLAEALALCRVHRAALVVANVSRLSRWVAFLSKLLAADVEIRFVDLPKIEGPTGKFMLHQMASVAELEAGMISDRTKKALAAAKVVASSLAASEAAPELRLISSRLGPCGRRRRTGWRT